MARGFGFRWKKSPGGLFPIRAGMELVIQDSPGRMARSRAGTNTLLVSFALAVATTNMPFQYDGLPPMD